MEREMTDLSHTPYFPPDGGYVSPPMPITTPHNGVLAMVYINPQRWQEQYDPETGFSRGTIFPGLDLPFLEGGNRSE